MAAIPPALVPALRAALTAQGFPGESITADGNVDPVLLASGVFDTVEVRTLLTPPIRIRTSTLAPSSAPSGFWQLFRPTVEFTGPRGTYTLAPFGAINPLTGWVGAGAAVAALVGLGYWLGKRA